jgi:hypothetical protein
MEIMQLLSGKLVDDNRVTYFKGYCGYRYSKLIHPAWLYLIISSRLFVEHIIPKNVKVCTSFRRIRTEVTNGSTGFSLHVHQTEPMFTDCSPNLANVH